MEVLSAFVREKSPLPDAKQVEEQPLVKIATDIQAALTVIKRRDLSQDLELQHLDLSGTYLRQANLSGTNLHGITLCDVDLSGAELTETSLTYADLRGANLTGANLSGTYLDGAKLTRAILKDVVLIEGSLEEADLSQADLSNICLIDTSLRMANFKNAVGLIPEQIKAADDWKKANYDEEFRQKLGLPPEQKS